LHESAKIKDSGNGQLCFLKSASLKMSAKGCVYVLTPITCMQQHYCMAVDVGMTSCGFAS